ncbi:hypothetical protein D3C86_1460020 [compost metagenome]
MRYRPELVGGVHDEARKIGLDQTQRLRFGTCQRDEIIRELERTGREMLDPLEQRVVRHGSGWLGLQFDERKDRRLRRAHVVGNEAQRLFAPAFGRTRLSNIDEAQRDTGHTAVTAP